MKYFVYILTFIVISCQSGEEPVLEEPEFNAVDQIVIPDAAEVTDTTVPMDFDLRKIAAADLPDLDYDGNCFDAWVWDDKNGENYFIRTLEEPILHEENEDGWELTDQYLHVYHYNVREDASVILLRDLTDFVKGCGFDLLLYHLDAIELTDLNQNNIGEITFGYRAHCTSDVSPSTQKVLIYENGNKYILRGESEALGYGGDYEPGSEFDTAPEAFLEQAAQFWETNKVEYALTEE